MAQIEYNSYVPNLSAETWTGTTHLEFELSYNKNTNETTINFTPNASYHYYKGRRSQDGSQTMGSQAETIITISAADNSDNKTSIKFFTYGGTTGSAQYYYGTPESVTVKHSSLTGEKKIKVESSTTVNVYILYSSSKQHIGTGSYSGTVALPATPVGQPTSFTTSAQAIIVPTGSIPLSWSGAAAGVNNDIVGYWLYWKEGSKPTASSYGGIAKIDSSATSGSHTFSFSSSARTRGSTIYTAILVKGSSGENYEPDLKDGPTVKINSLPAAPTLSATSAALPSTAGAYSVKVTAGKDSDSSQTIQVRQGSGGTAQASGMQFSLKDAGTFTFYSFDGLENSATGTSITIVRNIKPVVSSISTTFSASTNTNDKTVSTAQLDNADTKKLTAAQWYVRSAATSAEVSNATAKQIITGTITNSSNDDTSQCTLVINPLASSPIVSPGYYYQIGVQLKDEYEYSDIKWASDVEQIYGQLSLTLNNVTASHSETGMTATYASYYRVPKINLSWKSPSAFPTGLSSLWYSIFYSIDAGSSWKQWTSGIQSLEANTTYTPTIDFSSVGRGDFLAKIVLYDKKDGSNQKLETAVSNKLYYSPDPQWATGSTPTLAYTIQANDGRTCVRPNYSSRGTNALNLSVPYPSTVNTLLQTNKADLRYEVYLYQDGVSGGAQLRTKQAVTYDDSTATEDGPMKVFVTYDEITENVWFFLGTTNTKYVGPYNMSIAVRFYDAFGESIDTPKMSFVLDFREKPQTITALKIGRDGVLSNDYAAVAAKRSAETVIFPANDADNSTKSILSGEYLIIAFQKPKLSYAAQSIGQYIFTLYDNDDKVIYTYRTATLLSGSIYGESSMNCVVIPAIDFVGNPTMFYVKIRQQDSQSYNGNISDESGASNSLCGGDIEQPIINFEMPTISPVGNKLNVSYTQNTASLVWNGIQSSKYNAYLRQMKYSSITYSPSCEMILQLSPDNNFTAPEEISLAASTSTYTLKSGNSSTEVELSGKCFVRLKVIYNTGLKLNSAGEIETNQIVLYSVPKIYFNEAPTVSYRQNQVGVNGAPDVNTAFKVSMTQDNYLVTLEGYDTTTPTIIHSITFDLANGKIVSTNFMATQDEIDEICNGTYVNARELTY